MGARLSKDPNDVQLLIRDRAGQIHLMTTRPEETSMEDCVPLPISMEPQVRYLFLSNTDKKWHAHVYADNICDTIGNDVIAEDKLLNNTPNTRNLAYMKYTPNTNSTHFNFTKDEVNKPEYPFFKDQNNKQQYTAKSAFTKCKEMPFYANKDKGITINHNGIATVVYTDNECKNEYITNIPMDPKNPQYEGDRKYNKNNRTLSKEDSGLPFTNVKTYVQPSSATNARFYRTFRTDYVAPPPAEYPG